MDQRDTTILQLRASITEKDRQLKAAVDLAGKAADDLRKYRDLTVKMEGLRDVLFHQRKTHAEGCPDHAKGCQWDLGVLAFLASSMGITAKNFAHKLMIGMLVQYDAAIRKAQGKPVEPMGPVLSLIAQPSVSGDVPVIGRTQKPIGTKAEVHVFKKGATDAGRPVQPATEGAAPPVPESPAGADAQGSGSHGQTTRRRPDVEGGAPKQE
jgi:hypothetical protein